MIELLTFFNEVKSSKWIALLWNKLCKIRAHRQAELEKINDIMFGDPVELAQYYTEPDCQEMNPANLEVEDKMVAKQPVMVKINEFFDQSCFHQGSNQLFALNHFRRSR